MASTRACLSVTCGSSTSVASIVRPTPQAEHARSEHLTGQRGEGLRHRANVATVSKLRQSSNVDAKSLKWRRECITTADADAPSSQVRRGSDKTLGIRDRCWGSAFARTLDARTNARVGRSQEAWRMICGAAVKEEQPGQAPAQTTSIKEYLEDLKAVGRVRLIVNTGVAVLESVTSLETLFYHALPRGEYANIMSREQNVDFHLLLGKVASARLVRGKSMKGNIPTYMVRFIDVDNSNAVTLLVMWKPGTDGEYDLGQVDAFEALQRKYGEEVRFLSG